MTSTGVGGRYRPDVAYTKGGGPATVTKVVVNTGRPVPTRKPTVMGAVQPRQQAPVSQRRVNDWAGISDFHPGIAFLGRRRSVVPVNQQRTSGNVRQLPPVRQKFQTDAEGSEPRIVKVARRSSAPKTGGDFWGIDVWRPRMSKIRRQGRRPW